MTDVQRDDGAPVFSPEFDGVAYSQQISQRSQAELVALRDQIGRNGQTSFSAECLRIIDSRLAHVAEPTKLVEVQ